MDGWVDEGDFALLSLVGGLGFLSGLGRGGEGRERSEGQQQQEGRLYL